MIIRPPRRTLQGVEQARELAACLVAAGAGGYVAEDPVEWDGPGSLMEVRVFCALNDDGAPSCYGCGPDGDEPSCARWVTVIPGPPPRWVADQYEKEKDQ